jgi:hypothetical protein
MGRFHAAPGNAAAPAEGTYLTVRRRAGAGWETLVDSAVALARPAR